jgi:hypothetical protein
MKCQILNLRFKTFICLMAFFSFSSQVMAQQEGLFLRFIHNEKVALKLDYFGELVLHPGLSLGVDYTLPNFDHVCRSESGSGIHAFISCLMVQRRLE